MANIGRNDPCLCGSGKKHKKCCLAAAQPVPSKLHPESEGAREPTGYVAIEDDLDKVSNSVIGLLRQGQLDEALTVCGQLQRDYPDVIDYLERFAMVHEARGDFALAADYYRRALAFTEQPDQRDGFDEEGRVYYREKIAETQARTAS